MKLDDTLVYSSVWLTTWLCGCLHSVLCACCMPTCIPVCPYMFACMSVCLPGCFELYKRFCHKFLDATQVLCDFLSHWQRTKLKPWEVYSGPKLLVTCRSSARKKLRVRVKENEKRTPTMDGNKLHENLIEKRIMGAKETKTSQMTHAALYCSTRLVHNIMDQ